MFKGYSTNKLSFIPALSRHMAFWLAFCVFSVGLMGFTGCGHQKNIPEVKAQAHLKPKTSVVLSLTPKQEAEIEIELGQADVLPFERHLVSAGQVQAVSSLLAHIYSPVMGRMTQVMVNTGQPIRAGAPLAILLSDEIGRIQSDLLQQNLEDEADIRQAKVEQGYAELALKREEHLFNERISSKADLEAAKSRWEKTTETLCSLEARKKATISVYQERLSLYGSPPGTAFNVVQSKRISPYITIRSPRDGLLISRSVNAGELVDPTKELFSIADLSRVWLVGNIYERDIRQVHLDQAVHVNLDSLKDHLLQGRVSYMASILDPQTRTLEIRVEVPNTQEILKPNMFARMQIEVGKDARLCVPKSAVQSNGDFSYVYIPVGHHRYEERQVQVGEQNERFIEIVSGLNEHDPVVLNGTAYLKGEALKMIGSNVPIDMQKQKH